MAKGIKKLNNSHFSSQFQKLKDKIIKEYGLSRTCQDIDLMKLRDNCIEAVIEVKTGKYSNSDWKPFVKKNYPNLAFNRLDDVNFQALAKLTEKCSIKLLLFRVKKDNVKQGIKVYEITLSNEDLVFKLFGDYPLEYFIEKSNCTSNEILNERKLITVKDSTNPNLSDINNLYHLFNQNEKLSNCYYIEREGVWTMLISNEKTHDPIWIYIELNIESNLKLYNTKESWLNEFMPCRDLALLAEIPFSVICYTEDLKTIVAFDFIENYFNPVINISNGMIESFKSYYFNKIK